MVVILPNLLAYGLGAYLFYAQHNFPEVRYKCDNEWTYEASALESSSYIKMGRIMMYVTGNIGYHHIHHINPNIPFYRLPEAMSKIPGLQNPITTTLGLRDVRSCIRLKIWDEEKKKMTPI
jgi:omega-6 fatty acid desaturase (delta-12 desaturase)